MNLLHFPGTPGVSQIVHAILMIGGVMALYLIFLRILIHYIPASSPGNRTIGFVIGTGIGFFFARFETLIFAQVFRARPDYVSIALILAILLQTALAHHFYYPRGTIS